MWCGKEGQAWQGKVAGRCRQAGRCVGVVVGRTGMVAGVQAGSGRPGRQAVGKAGGKVWGRQAKVGHGSR